LDGQVGDVRIVERATGQEVVLARDVTVEDAHRAACQQWICGGRQVAFHDVRDGRWTVNAVDVATRTRRVLAHDRQIGWGMSQGNLVPVYGCHWNPGKHRDLEILNVETGEIRTVLTASAVREKYPDGIAKAFQQRPISVFFPTLSPDGKRAFFKLATPAGGDFRSRNASDRAGLVCCDLEARRLTFFHGKWGHPCWHPDSQTIIQPGGVLIDAATGAIRRIPDLPAFRGSHPSVSPDGRLFVTDTLSGAFGGPDKQWAIAVGSMRGGDWVILHRFDNSRGARSWRRSDPHPAMSPDGRRIYFNASSTDWTQLHVAECE
jgi:Tol biopolymer transport system component